MMRAMRSLDSSDNWYMLASVCWMDAGESGKSRRRGERVVGESQGDVLVLGVAFFRDPSKRLMNGSKAEVLPWPS